MSLLLFRPRPDRCAGLVLIAIFTLGILGGALATATNGGNPPRTTAAKLQRTTITAPM